jgi:hypothetical protein
MKSSEEGVLAVFPEKTAESDGRMLGRFAFQSQAMRGDKNLENPAIMLVSVTSVAIASATRKCKCPRAQRT